MVGGAVASSLGTTVQFCEGTNANILAEVDMSRNGRYNCDAEKEGEVPLEGMQGSPILVVHTCADVVPVRVVRSELLECAGLDDIHPCWDLELARTLEVGGVCGDESLSTK